MKIVKEDVNNINDKATPVYDANLVLDAEIANDRAEQVKNIVDPYERENAKPFIGAEKQPLPKEEEPKITKEKEAKPFEESLNEDIEIDEENNLVNDLFNALSDLAYKYRQETIDMSASEIEKEFRDAFEYFCTNFFVEEEVYESLTEGELDRNATKAEKDFWDQLNELD